MIWNWVRANGVAYIALFAVTVLIVLRIHDARVPPIHRFGGGAAQSDFISAKIFNIQTFGAKCDGATDDTAAINATITAAAAAPGSTVLIPGTASACMVSSMVTLPAGVSVLGTATNLGHNTIRASASMRAVLLAQTVASSINPYTPARVSGITLDGNNFTLACVERAGSLLTSWGPRLFMTNCGQDGMLVDAHYTPAVFSSFSQSIGGGSPSMSLANFVQTNRNYIGLIIASGAGTNLKIKIVSSGGLGAATYIPSYDGGTTFQTAAVLTVAAVSHLPYATGTSTPAFNYDTGIEIHFPAGGYIANDTYALNAAAQLESGGGGVVVEGEGHVDGMWVKQAGTAYATTSYRSQYFGAINDATLAPGTITLTPGSELVVGSATTFLSGATQGRIPRSGDFLILPNMVHCPIVNQCVFMIGGVLDDTHLYLTNNTAVPSLSGEEYAIVTGHGYYEVPGGDYCGAYVDHSTFDFVANGMHHAGQPCGWHANHNFVNVDYAGVGLSIGDGEFDASEVNGDSNDIIRGAVSQRTIEYFANGLSTGTLMESGRISSTLDLAGTGAFTFFFSGVEASQNNGNATLMPHRSFGLVPNVVTVTSNTQTIPAPAMTIDEIASSYVVLLPTADFVMQGAPIFGAPSQPVAPSSLWMYVQNHYNSGHYLTFLDGYNGTGVDFSGPTELLAPGDGFWLRFDNPSRRWTQASPISRLFFGSAAGIGAEDGESTAMLTTTNATPAVMPNKHQNVFTGVPCSILRWDVTAVDTGSSNRGMWSNMNVFVDGSGHLINFSLGFASGTNSGTPPAGWAVVPTESPSQTINCQVTGAAATTIKWYIRETQTSCLR